MATVAENLQTILDIKSDIKTAIINKGVSVADSDSFTTYADKIESIESGGSSVLESITITENGTYTPNEGVDGFNKVDVNVTGKIMPLISPDTLKEVMVSAINDSGYLIENNTFFIYDGYCVENPENREIGVPNYTYNGGTWGYVKDVNDNNYLTPSNFMIDKYLKDNDVEIRHIFTSMYKTIGGLVGVNDSISTTYLYNIDGTEYEVRYNNDTYTIANDMYPRDLVSGNAYENFYPVIKPAYVYGYQYDYLIDNLDYKGKRLKGYYNDYEYSNGIYDLSKRIYFSEYCIIDDFNLSNYSTTYCPFVAPELKINFFQGKIQFASDVYQKITIEEYVDGYETFQYCRGLKELIINNFLSGGNYFIYSCDNLETLHIGDMSSFGYVDYYLFLGAHNLKNISGFNNLGMGFTSYQYVRMNNLYNLTKESVINIFNGLYDMNQNPNVQTSTISLDYSSKALLSDEDIAIATNKGWIIS